jgi:hypothetical protein
LFIFKKKIPESKELLPGIPILSAGAGAPDPVPRRTGALVQAGLLTPGSSYVPGTHFMNVLLPADPVSL